MGRGGGATKREGGGALEVLPLRKGWVILKGGGGTKRFGVDFTR